MSRLALLKFFPSEPEALAALAEIICKMTADERKAEWLIERALQVFDEWPGPKKLRALYCRRWKPADGVEAYTSDEERERWQNLPEPPTPWEKRIEAPKALQLEGPRVPLDFEFEAGFNKLYEKTQMPGPRPLPAAERRRKAQFDRVLEAVLIPPEQRTEPPVPPAPTPQVFNLADIEEAVRKNREAGITWRSLDEEQSKHAQRS
jgi:hypothetical protein